MMRSVVALRGLKANWRRTASRKVQVLHVRGAGTEGDKRWAVPCKVCLGGVTAALLQHLVYGLELCMTCPL